MPRECSQADRRYAELKQGKFEICERGVLVKPGDVKSFAKGLRYLLEHHKVERQGRRGAVVFKKSWELKQGYGSVPRRVDCHRFAMSHKGAPV